MTFDAKARAEDLTWMAATGENATGAARRLGISRDALEVWAKKHAPAAWYRLLAREPRDHNVPSVTALADSLRQLVAEHPMPERRTRGGRPRKNPECGTEQGYQSHRWYGEKCAPCLAAHAAHERARQGREDAA